MLINTTPGSVALDVSPDRKTLYVHVMYMQPHPTLRARRSSKASNGACWDYFG